MRSGYLLLWRRGHHVSLCVEDLVVDSGTLRGVGHACHHVHLACVACCHGQVRQMGAGHGKERDVAEDAHRCPVVEAVELEAFVAAVDTHGQLLRLAREGLLGEEGREVKEARVIGHLPRSHLTSVEPEVVAAQHAVEADAHTLSLPRRWHGKRGAVIAGERVRGVVRRLAEAVLLPAARHGNGAPRCVAFGHLWVAVDAVDNFQMPRAVEAFHHLLVGGRIDALEGIGQSGSQAEAAGEKQ